MDSKVRIASCRRSISKTPRSNRLAKALATRRGTSATGTVRKALREALERDAQRREGCDDRLLAIGRRSAARPELFVTEADLYDEHGLPR